MHDFANLKMISNDPNLSAEDFFVVTNDTVNFYVKLTKQMQKILINNRKE